MQNSGRGSSKHRRLKIAFRILFVAALICVIWAGLPGQRRVLVRKVLSPNKILVSTPKGGTEILCYSHLEPAREGTPEYEEGLERNRELVYGRMIRVEFDGEVKRDHNGNLIGNVFVLDHDGEKEKDVGLALVKAGLVRVEADNSSGKYLEKLNSAQENARADGKGIWQNK